MTAASDSAEALIRGVSERIRAATENVNSDNVDEVDTAFNDLEELADQLDSEAGQLSAAVVENTPADPSAAPVSDSSTSSGASESETLDPHSREGAAAAGGYDAPQGQQSSTVTEASASAGPPAGSVVADTDAASAAKGDTTDAEDGDRITSQDGREAAGPFTGTGAQDALRTSGRLGDTDAHAADTRTVENGAEERTPSGDGGSATDEGDTADGDDAA